MSDISPEQLKQIKDEHQADRNDNAGTPPQETHNERRNRVAQFFIKQARDVLRAGAPDPMGTKPISPLGGGGPKTPADLNGHGATESYTDSHGFEVTTLKDDRSSRRTQRH